MHNRTRIIPPILGCLLLLGLWELGITLSKTPAYVLPAPSAIFLAFCHDLPLLLRHGSITLAETIAGLLISVLLAVLIAVCMDVLPVFRSVIYPLLVVTQTVPVIVLAPIFVIYLGFGMAPKIITVVLMCFFPIVIAFADGLTQQDPQRVNLVRSMGANLWKQYTLVKFPAAMPSFFSGLKIAATYSISGAVVGEWLSASAGLGYYMLRVKNGYMLDRVFACVLMIVLLSLLLNGAVKLLARLLIRPHQKTGGTTP